MARDRGTGAAARAAGREDLARLSRRASNVVALLRGSGRGDGLPRQLIARILDLTAKQVEYIIDGAASKAVAAMAPAASAAACAPWVHPVVVACAVCGTELAMDQERTLRHAAYLCGEACLAELRRRRAITGRRTHATALRDLPPEALKALPAGEHALLCDYRVRAHHATPAYRNAMRKRAVWVEPLFGEAKQWHGLRQFRLRGLRKVNAEALLVATGQNLKRLLAAAGWGRRHAPCGALQTPHHAAALHEPARARGVSRRGEARSCCSWRRQHLPFSTGREAYRNPEPSTRPAAAAASPPRPPADPGRTA